MRVKYFICSESTSFDQFSNRVSIFHVLEQVATPAYPIALPSFVVVLCLEREPNEPANLTARVTISQNGADLGAYDLGVSFGDATVARALGTMQGFFVPTAGLMTIAASIDGQRIASWEIAFTQVGQAELQLAPAPPA